MIAPSPSAYVTDELYWFGQQCLLLEPGTESGGYYADKPGYHNTRAANAPDDYSVREADDQSGPSDKCAAFDWTFPNAQAGDYHGMDKYGERLQKAWNDYDPRCNGWREALGQTDLDATAEGLDFRHHTTRTPDSSHAWHWHFSCDRKHVTNLDNMKAMLSVLKGETLDAYLAAGGQLVEEDMTPSEFLALLNDPSVAAKMRGFAWAYQDAGDKSAHDIVLGQMRAQLSESATGSEVQALTDAVNENTTKLQELITAVTGGTGAAGVYNVVGGALQIERAPDA